MADAVRALLFVRGRSAVRQGRRLPARPVTWLAAAALVISAHAGGVAGRGAPTAFIAGHTQAIGLLGAGLLAVVALLVLTGTSSSPLRLGQPDIAWLAAAPGGLRALAVAQTTSSTALAAVAAAVWMALTLAFGALSLAAALGTVLVTVGLVATMRGVSVAAHVAGTWRPARPGLRAAGFAVLAASVAAAATVAVDGAVAAGPLAPLRAVAGAVAAGLWRPDVAHGVWTAAVGLAALAIATGLTARWASRLLEPAAATSAAMSSLAETLEGAWSPAELLAAGVPRGVRSWTPRWEPKGSRALIYRGACHERRLVRRAAARVAAAIVASAAATGLPDHGAAFVVLGVAAITTVGELSGPMALEGRDGQLFAMPGGRVALIIWLHLPRTVTVLVTLLAGWLPAVALGAVSLGFGLAVALTLPAVAAAIVAAGCVTALVGGPLVAQVWRLALLAGLPLVVALTPVAAVHHLLEATSVAGATAIVVPAFVGIYLLFAYALIDARDRPATG